MQPEARTPLDLPTAPSGPATQALATAPPAHRPGYASSKAAHRARLRRIEGQVRGLQRLVDEDTYCIDVLTQVAATTRALQSFAVALLGDHLGSCVAAACEEGGPDADARVAEATAAVARLLRA